MYQIPVTETAACLIQDRLNTMPKDDSRSAVEYATATIQDLIKRGEFAPGQRLVVADLVKRLQVSAGPVREAIRRLTGEGLLEVRPNRGAIVRSLSQQELANVYDLREVIEGLLARQCANNIRQAENANVIKDIIKRINAARKAGDIKRYSALNQEFHTAIYRIAGNERGKELATQLVLPLYQLSYHQLMNASMMNQSCSEHEQIAEAILAADPINAERLMRLHIRNSGVMILESTAQQFGEQVYKKK